MNAPAVGAVPTSSGQKQKLKLTSGEQRAAAVTLVSCIVLTPCGEKRHQADIRCSSIFRDPAMEVGETEGLERASLCQWHDKWHDKCCRVEWRKKDTVWNI